MVRPGRILGRRDRTHSLPEDVEDINRDILLPWKAERSRGGRVERVRVVLVESDVAREEELVFGHVGHQFRVGL